MKLNNLAYVLLTNLHISLSTKVSETLSNSVTYLQF